VNSCGVRSSTQGLPRGTGIRPGRIGSVKGMFQLERTTPLGPGFVCFLAPRNLEGKLWPWVGHLESYSPLPAAPGFQLPDRVARSK
jgi:hypothetical protein